MKHQSLYRRYRPHTFADLVGQEQVVEAFSEQIKNNRVGHAYIFAGSRGLGKTSVARIVARELGVSDRDLYEIDAASNNGVDYIRELSENIYTLPFESPYKLFILDEAHMLSKGAWNAFLKTLEEPPAYAIFILATTELEKIPETVQSRCQVYEFKKPSRAVLAALISDVAKKEGYDVTPSASELLALLADGSYRDALSVLEKALSRAEGNKLSLEAAEKATGAPRQSLVNSFIASMSEGTTEGALGAIFAAKNADVDMNLYLTLILESIRNILLVRYAPEFRAELEKNLGAEGYADIEKCAKEKNSKLSHKTLSTLLDAASRMRFSPIPSLPLEIAVLELANHEAGEV